MAISKRMAIIGAFGYFVVGIITFGHAASGYMATEKCDGKSPIAAAFCKSDRRSMSALHGVMAGIAWPFYWSWEAQS